MTDFTADTDLCVKCGLCLPHCPTYAVTQNENESPRGRIALMQAWSQQQLADSPKLQQHISNCLICRSCESVCPAKVPYSSLVDRYKEQSTLAKKETFSVWALKKVTQTPRLNKLAQSTLSIYQQKGLQSLAKKVGMHAISAFADFDRLLPDNDGQQSSSAPLDEYYPASMPAKGQVALFKGCLGELLDSDVMTATISVLNHSGYDVLLPSNQVCCGALDLHGGHQAAASLLIEKNIKVFQDLKVSAIVSIASGCGATLQEYPDLSATLEKTTWEIKDISQFLWDNNALQDVNFLPLEETVIVHSPCTLKNVMKQEQSVQALLTKIPGIKLINLPENIRCCGSAGAFMLEQPDLSKEVREMLLDELIPLNPARVVTSNIGCKLYIHAGLKEKGLAIPTVHPMVLLHQQIADNQ